MDEYHLGIQTALGKIAQTFQVQLIAKGGSGIMRKPCTDPVLLKCIHQTLTIIACDDGDITGSCRGFDVDFIFDIRPLANTEHIVEFPG